MPALRDLLCIVLGCNGGQQEERRCRLRNTATVSEPWLRIDGISGTSTGVMTAAVLADAHVAGARGVGEGLAEGVPGGAAGFSRANSTAANTNTSDAFGIYRWGWGFSTNQDFNGDIALIACFASSWTPAK